jgi:hypothetical protein
VIGLKAAGDLQLSTDGVRAHPANEFPSTFHDKPATPRCPALRRAARPLTDRYGESARTRERARATGAPGVEHRPRLDAELLK